ncbi:hypothetical protein M0D68_19205 [Paraburkholderia sp. SEWSISQ10-3 4]|uniref:hypothetical protein n=1 Tax=Paraburkholderia TaxID=1822464 RepID=UPI0022584C92|nr:MULTISPECIES: hypothetical protein [Paraburkholderia]MCX4140333.1 hypothetical protein [Paraburkholderia aspalathi]MDN7173020.1 hypothetical protein [Paraburkholderia sp. SEWSISQ10-3 4]MDQ6502659.1 hypothetical protein [Paraburkholderia aspalathi]
MHTADHTVEQTSPRPIRLLILGVAIISLVLAGLAIIPFQPMFAMAPPDPSYYFVGLDSSWAYAMNEAVARHLVFGRDVIFTFGPFASVYTTLYHPATDSIMLVGSAILAAGLCAGFFLIGFDRRPMALLLLPLIVALSLSRDAIFLSIPLLLMLATYRIATRPESEHHLAVTPSVAILVAIVSGATGILPIVKGSFAGLVGAEGVITIAMLLYMRRGRTACGVLVTAALSLCIGWVAAGQPLAQLPHFFVAQGPIISGYSEAMSRHGPFTEVLYWMVAAATAAILFYVCVGRTHAKLGILAIAGIAIYLFIVFKAGFVRQDGHERMSAASMLFLALALSTFLRRVPAVVLCIVAVVSWGAMEYTMPDFQPDFLRQRTVLAYESLRDGLDRRLTSPSSFPGTFAQGNEQIRALTPIRDVSGTADVYPWNLSILFANQIPWNGRPILQSYSAYRPRLDQANADHLTSAQAPENVFFQVKTIDDRLPTLDDALSWLVLLRYYTIVSDEHGYLRMARTLPPRPYASTPLADIDTSVEEPISIPATDGIVIARIHMRPTILGRLVLGAFKLPQVFIEITLNDGRSFKYRYIPAMGETGFLLSPLVKSNADLLSIATANNSRSRVKEIKLLTPSVGMWSRGVHVTLENVHIAPQPIDEKLLKTSN